ncbi:serine O-acetyltransferase [Parasphingorhabdus cellanae]|uniref:Hexapeptide transferase n=1 Tax=Parasphingorhabdus cellanae TaxID=2806553 RepID=A0ABX7TB72_9SPHN|nr:hexapeptide transferase [Parasphingorhabdus cellanae]QTD57867.1 hexapeptide transferase [Parasphingorhabdus cellanae]
MQPINIGADDIGPNVDRSLQYTWALILSDLYRYAGNRNTLSFLRHFLFTPGFKYSTVMRLCGYLKKRRLMRFILYPPLKLLLLRYRYKYGIAIPEYTRIGPGFFINRFGNIMVNGDAIIGANCNITHGSMLGQMNRGPNQGSPILGDGVFLAAGCKVIGKITIGHRAAVGANAVVTKPVPDDAAVGGIPAKILSMKGSEGYINRRVDPDYGTRFRAIS